MNGSILQAETITMAALNNLFIEMTSKSCNQHCKHCYIDFPKYKKVEDFIPIEIIQKELEISNDEMLNCIYLTGAEPMTHPDFNAILRLCLKRSNVCICTNGSFINEKKARFLKKVSDETNNEVIFKISIDHYDEIKNDDIRSRGAFRQALFAVKSLVKYNFTPIINVVNYYNETYEDLFCGFKSVFDKIGFDIDASHLNIVPWHNKNSHQDEKYVLKNQKPDCSNGRVLSSSGIYACPFLSSDYRGRCGSSLDDYNKKCVLETEFCATCLKSKNLIFGIDFENFA